MSRRYQDDPYYLSPEDEKKLEDANRAFRAELLKYGREIIEAHSDLVLSDIHEQLDAHFESDYPTVSQMLIHGVIEELMDELYYEQHIASLDNGRAWPMADSE